MRDRAICREIGRWREVWIGTYVEKSVGRGKYA